MADEVSISIRLRNAAKFAADSAKSAASIKAIGTASDGAAGAARRMGGAVGAAASGMTSALGAAAGQAKYLAFGLGAVAAAGIKMGLSFNAQIESARLRFGLFTNDVDGLTAAVQKIDMESAFDLASLSDAAAMLGNSGIKDVPGVLQAAANAAAASGKGVQSLNSIAIALSQIQSKGKLSQEEINQLNEAGAPGAQRTIAKAFSLTSKELGNLGGQGLDAQEAIQALTDEWTSGKMAKAAAAQTKTLGGQWNLLTGNIQKLSGAATESLAADLRDTAIPAANKAATAITEIFGREGLSNEEKLRKARAVIVKELGPVWEDLGDAIEDADIPSKLGTAIEAATPLVLNAMADIAPKAAKAFIDGWMASGWEVQAVTALLLGNKIRKGAGFGGGGGAGGGGIGARGATPANPLFVAVVNGGVPGGGTGKKVADVAKMAAPWAAKAGTVGVGAGVAGLLGYVAYKNAANDYPSRGPVTGARQTAGTIPAPGFGTSTPGALNVHATFNVDGKTVSRTTATTDAIEQGRLAASRAAGG